MTEQSFLPAAMVKECKDLMLSDDNDDEDSWGGWGGQWWGGVGRGEGK